jgi:hypothetical protein
MSHRRRDFRGRPRASLLLLLARPTVQAPPPDPGDAPTADFSIAANSQLIAALMGDF